VELYAETDPRGEYVLVVEGAKEAHVEESGYPENPQEHLQALMESGMDRMDAIKSAAKERGMSKGAFYKLLLGTSPEE
jgi:16S rRNA (cytidine1402-2'-O)-methyltransferase